MTRFKRGKVEEGGEEKVKERKGEILYIMY